MCPDLREHRERRGKGLLTTYNADAVSKYICETFKISFSIQLCYGLVAVPQANRNWDSKYFQIMYVARREVATRDGNVTICDDPLHGHQSLNTAVAIRRSIWIVRSSSDRSFA